MIDLLCDIYGELKTLRKNISAEVSNTIAKKSLRQGAESLGTKWFSEVSVPLANEYNISIDIIESYSQNFARLIKISAPNNLKKSYLETLNKLSRHFRDDLIIPLQKRPKIAPLSSSLEKILEDLPNPEENEYLKEAVDCAKRHFLRASIVLGWCVTIDRIHRKIEKIGFAKFNITSSSMASQKKGRFKRFSSPQNVSSISELREVFDPIILWVLEGMQLIDSNQHTRLRSCFELRCQCAHPGEAPVTEYNLLSYFSDLKEIVFKNSMFTV